MAHLIQVGAGSGGMPVLDLLCRDSKIEVVTLIEPDVYKAHNVDRHLFPLSAVGRPKADLAVEWLAERRPDLEVRVLKYNLLDPLVQADIEQAATQADLGICAADNEPAKYHWDAIMRRTGKPWTLGEVLSGGIGGFVHWFVPGGPCYGCVASYLQRSVKVAEEKAPDYSQPGGAAPEVAIPANKASIQTIASMHALITLGLLDNPHGYNPGFTSFLFTMQRVPDVFDEMFRPYRFRIPRSETCLICRSPAEAKDMTAEELDVALDQALSRLGDA
jgi:molybdopterin/thiamine biosynthesis adenylyltransferase